MLLRIHSFMLAHPTRRKLCAHAPRQCPLIRLTHPPKSPRHPHPPNTPAPQVVSETTETDRIVALCKLRKGTFGYALANGTVGVYTGPGQRRWRVKSKHEVTSILGFDLDGDGEPELISGWSNGLSTHPHPPLSPPTYRPHHHTPPHTTTHRSTTTHHHPPPTTALTVRTTTLTTARTTPTTLKQASLRCARTRRGRSSSRTS